MNPLLLDSLQRSNVIIGTVHLAPRWTNRRPRVPVIGIADRTAFLRVITNILVRNRNGHIDRDLLFFNPSSADIRLDIMKLTLIIILLIVYNYVNRIYNINIMV